MTSVESGWHRVSQDLFASKYVTITPEEQAYNFSFDYDKDNKTCIFTSRIECFELLISAHRRNKNADRYKPNIDGFNRNFHSSFARMEIFRRQDVMDRQFNSTLLWGFFFSSLWQLHENVPNLIKWMWVDPYVTALEQIPRKINRMRWRGGGGGGHPFSQKSRLWEGCVLIFYLLWDRSLGE